MHCKGLLSLTRRLSIDRSPYLAERSLALEWPNIEDLRDQLLCLLESKPTPDLCLLLTKNSNDDYDWTLFRKYFFTLKLRRRRSIEAVVVNTYLSHLAQLYHEAPHGKFMVLDPKDLVDYMHKGHRDNPERDLAYILKNASEVPLAPGEWQDRCAVLKWRASLAVWRMRRGPASMYSTEPPPAYESSQALPDSFTKEKY
ncbi:hypothetical protein PWT90_10807 [Aphanocladium album]|nr:hypothetical protein PWT90_10807 [Aphanocladium album]